MSDLISRQAAIDETWKEPEYTDPLNVLTEIRDRLMALPTIEPERKKGKWIDAVLPNDSGGLQVQVCDQCNTFFPLAYTGGGHNFCPNCGARMEASE